MKPQQYTSIYTQWDVNLETATFCSPSIDIDPPGQVVVFSDKITNGSISASITAIEGQWNPELQYEFHECALVCRYTNEDHFYVAGIGGFGQQFYIAKSLQYDTPWQLLRATGSAHDLRKGTIYHLQIEFVDERLTLFSDGVEIISATDDTYDFGVCGLRTNRTQARFENVDIRPYVTLRLSPSVQQATREIPHDVTNAIPIVRNLLSLHQEYAAGKARTLQLAEVQKSRTQSVNDWLLEVRALYEQATTPELHGRVVIYGLALLDPYVAEQLAKDGFIQALEQEVVAQHGDVPVATLLTESGRHLYDSAIWTGAGPSGAVPTHVDLPAKLDQLGRKAFAEALASRIRRIHTEGRAAALRQAVEPEEAGSFMLHIHGPWGSGKTSLLHLLREQLTSGDPKAHPEDEHVRWIVVSFNAWQHQRIGPPWWWLMNAVFHQTLQQLRVLDRLRTVKLWSREYVWRTKTAGWIPYLLTICLLYWLISITSGLHLFDAMGYGNPVPRGGGTTAAPPTPASPGANAKALSDILVLLTTLWGLFLTVSRSLLPGSARGAQGFMETTSDPMKVLTDHFSVMVQKIAYPVAVFIDDLDRCQSTFVVDLLEGIQTMFRRAPVTYVVASDRRWLLASFETAYAPFAEKLEEEGRPLGYFFTDKIFQLSTSVPQLSPETKQAYWERLVLGDTLRLQEGEQQEQMREEVRKGLARLDNEQDIISVVQSEQDPIKSHVLREEAIKLLATPAGQQQTYHMLLPFAALLEPNPRAMKRFVNAYGAHRDINILAGAPIELPVLARWTILNLRWPLLAHYLAARVSETTDNAPIRLTGIPENLSKLFKTADVQHVIGDTQYGAPLDARAIRECIGLRPQSLGAEVIA
jgi:KAP family P-loop domain